MPDIASILNSIAVSGPPPVISPTKGGLQFKDAAPMLCGVVDNGVGPEDPRVMYRTNEATKIILDTMLIPVGGYCSCIVPANQTVLVLPPELENVIEAYPADSSTKMRGDSDATVGWYEIVNDSAYLDPTQAHDNPLVDMGLWPIPGSWLASQYAPQTLVRVYTFPGLQPPNANVVVTGKKRFIPIKTKEDYLIVQNIEALKMVILSIERNENAMPDDAPKYRQQAKEIIEGEIKQHLADPRNYMRRKSQYQDEALGLPENTLGWVRANLALDIEEALKIGRMELHWSINQVERRMMQRGKIYKDMIQTIQASVVGGVIYTPINIEAVLAVDLNGRPIPIRSQFFQYLDNGPGMNPCHPMLIDEGNHLFPGTTTVRRRYKLVACCNEQQNISLVCLLKWMFKQPNDYMIIKNYEAIRLLMTAKFLEAKEQWQQAQQNQQQAYAILDTELETYLSGIRHTVHVQTGGFGLGDVGSFFTR